MLTSRAVLFIGHKRCGERLVLETSILIPSAKKKVHLDI